MPFAIKKGLAVYALYAAISLLICALAGSFETLLPGMILMLAFNNTLELIELKEKLCETDRS